MGRGASSTVLLISVIVQNPMVFRVKVPLATPDKAKTSTWYGCHVYSINKAASPPHANASVAVLPSALPSPLYLVDVFEGEGRQFPKPDQVVGEHQSPAAIQFLQVPSTRRGTAAGVNMLHRGLHILRQCTSGSSPVASRGGLLTLLVLHCRQNTNLTLIPSKLSEQRECGPNKACLILPKGIQARVPDTFSTPPASSARRTCRAMKDRPKLQLAIPVLNTALARNVRTVSINC